MATESTDLMEKLVSLCKRRGFIFQSSEIYGGINGFWDYGPLGVELKRNIKDAWWQDIVRQPRRHGRPGLLDHHEPARSGRPAATSSNFNDPMVDCKAVQGAVPGRQGLHRAWPSTGEDVLLSAGVEADSAEQAAQAAAAAKANSKTRRRLEQKAESTSQWTVFRADQAAGRPGRPLPALRRRTDRRPQVQHDVQDLRRRDGGLLGRGLPAARDRPGHLRQLQERPGHHARQGALRHRADRQELPQRDQPAELHLPLPRVRADGDRVLLPSRARPTSGTSTGATRGTSGTSAWACKSSKLRLRDHEKEELAHYARACADIEYEFPFGISELEGIANRTDYDLNAAPEVQRQGHDLLRRRDQGTVHPVRHRALGRRGPRDAGLPVRGVRRGRRPPTRTAAMQTRMVMKFHPRLAPIKVAVFPLVKKDGMPEIAEKIHARLQEGRPDQLLRREGRRRPPLPPPGRGRHAVLRHRGRPDAPGPDRHHPRPRQPEAGAHRRRPGRRLRPGQACALTGSAVGFCQSASPPRPITAMRPACYGAKAVEPADAH